MNQRAFMGLTHNPFEAPRKGFYPGADRKTHLEHLRHLSQWSRRILAVTGPVGVGKSSLFRELSNSLESNARGARISGSVATSERQVVSGLLQGFGIAADMDGHVDDLCQLIVAHVTDQTENNLTCMAMVDDAQALDAAALQRLVSLVSRSPLRLVLFAETSLVNNLDRAARQCEVEWFEIRLTGFPKADVRDYLEWRFRQAEYRGRLPFTEEQVEKIAVRSAGNPGMVDGMASRLLGQMETGEYRRRQGFPASHMILALLLALAVGLTYLYFNEVPEADTEVAAVTLDDAPADDSVADETAAAQLQAEQFEAPAPGPDMPAQSVPESGLQDAADDAPALAQDVSQAEPAQTGEEADPIAPVNRDEEPEDQAQVVHQSSTAQPLPSTPEERTPEQPNAQATAATEQAATAAQEQASPAASAGVVPVVESQPEASAPDRSYKSSAWLLRQNPDYYTLQLLSLSTAQRAEAFVLRQSEPAEFVIYTMRRDGRTLHVITYGVYSSRAAAQSAADNLQGELATIKPWIRPLALVQDTIRNFGQGS